jgi:hypothetical protein
MSQKKETGPFKVTAEWDEGQKEIDQTHVFANVDIPKGSYIIIMPEHLASSLSLSSHQAIEKLRGNLEYGGVSHSDCRFCGHESQAAGMSQ